MSAINYTEFESFPGNVPAHFFMPMLSVKLRGPAGLPQMQILVDSGAADTLIPTSILKEIGVEPSQTQVDLVSGAVVTSESRTMQMTRHETCPF